MKAVRYDRFAGNDGIYLADLPEPVPGPGEAVVRVEPARSAPGRYRRCTAARTRQAAISLE